MRLDRLTALANQMSLPLFEEDPAPAAVAAASETKPEVRASAPSIAAKPLVIPENKRIASLLGQTIFYELRRSSRKTIGFVLTDDGLVVTAPRWVRIHDMDAALQEKAAWILRALARQREREAQIQARKIEWRDGGSLPFLGAPITLVLDPACGSALLSADTRSLRLPLPHGAEGAQLRDMVQSWLQRQAKRLFEERVQTFADRLNVKVTAVKLSSARTQWGTANVCGTIRLNWRLIHFALPVIDYVAAHEVAHLKEMNHSPAFWNTVGKLFPDFEAAKRTLRTETLPAFD